MKDLTKIELNKIKNNTCPDCGAQDEFLDGPSGGESQNIICGKCQMRFNVAFGQTGWGERIGKEEKLELEPISIPEGTLKWSKHNSFEYLTHSCGGSIDLHRVDSEISVLVCRACMMRLQIPSLPTHFDIHAYKALFEYLKIQKPWEKKGI